MISTAMISLRRVRAVVVTLLLALAALGAAPAVALATTPAAGPPAYLRLAHLSPDTPTVDVYVDSAADPARSFVVPGVGYGAVSDYKPLPPDSYVISMRAAGAPASRRRSSRPASTRGRARPTPSPARAARPSWACRCSTTSWTARRRARRACG